MYPRTHSGNLNNNKMRDGVGQRTLVALVRETLAFRPCDASWLQHVTCVGSCIATEMLCVY
jgi:hypothetical protein